MLKVMEYRSKAVSSTLFSPLTEYHSPRSLDNFTLERNHSEFKERVTLWILPSRIRGPVPGKHKVNAHGISARLLRWLKMESVSGPDGEPRDRHAD